MPKSIFSDDGPPPLFLASRISLKPIPGDDPFHHISLSPLKRTPARSPEEALTQAKSLYPLLSPANLCVGVYKE